MVLLMCQQFNFQDYQQLVYLYFVICEIIIVFLGLTFAQVFVYILLSHTTASDAIHVSMSSLLSQDLGSKYFTTAIFFSSGIAIFCNPKRLHYSLVVYRLYMQSLDWTVGLDYILDSGFFFLEIFFVEYAGITGFVHSLHAQQ